MKRKNLLKQIFTSMLGVVILFATTGIHLSIHTCRMQELNSEIECDACLSEDTYEASSYENEVAENVLKISSEVNPCCSFKTISKKIDDNFVTIKTEEKLISSVKLHFPKVFMLPADPEIFSSKDFKENISPPFLIDNEKHITNSVLLI